jgi:hypothetical protein
VSYLTGAGRLLDLDYGTEREVRYEVWHDEKIDNGQLYLRNTQVATGFDWFEYVGTNRHLVLVLSTGRRLTLERMLLDGHFTAATSDARGSTRETA